MLEFVTTVADISNAVMVLAAIALVVILVVFLDGDD
jgi:hypothetical protein